MLKRKYKQRYRDEKREAEVHPEVISSVLLGVGLQPIGLKTLYWLSFKTEKRAQGERQRHRWFNGRRDLTRVPQMVGRWAGHGGGLCFQWEGAQVDIRLAHRLPGEVSRGAYLMAPLVNCHVGLGGGAVVLI